MARGRRAGYGDLLSARRSLALTLTALALAACALVPTTAPSISRDGTTLVVTIPGYSLRPAQGFLCPTDPGVGPTLDEAELRTVQQHGCLDLGSSEEPGSALTLRYNLESLAAAQIEAFANRSSYRLLLVSGSSPQGSVLAVDVPAVNLNP